MPELVFGNHTASKSLVAIPVLSAVPTDAAVPGAVDGSLAAHNAAGVVNLYVRVGGVWENVSTPA